MGLFFVVSAGHSDIDGTEQCEDESLDEGDQQFKAAHEDVEEHGDYGYTVADGRGHLTEDEDQGDETQHDDVAGGDVGEKSYHQHERFGEDADDFHERHDWKWNLQPPWHAGSVHDVNPVLFVAGELGDEESEECQDARDGDVAGEVRSAREYRNQAHQVVQQYEEEQSQQIGRVFWSVFAQ